MPCSLTNALGTGSPKLRLTLADNGGDKWEPFDINFQGAGNIPGSLDEKTNWSAWNISDEKNNYYGTITLHSDGNDNAWFKPDYYKQPDNGNRLADFKLTRTAAGRVTLTVGTIFPPFPTTPAATPAVYPGTRERIVLGCQGGKIVTNRGDEVVLKGVTRPSLEWSREGQYLSAADIARMRGWGSNIIRIPLSQDFWQASAGRDVAGSYKQTVDAMIYHAVEQRMAVILDLHTPTYAMANETAIAVWRDIAKTYRDFGTILFELFNEPNQISKEQWLQGGGGVGYQQLLDTVRNAGASNLCIIGGLDWAYDLSFVTGDFGVKGTGIVDRSHPYYNKGQGLGPSFEQNFAGILGRFPLIFTEFGGNNAGDYDGGQAKQYLLDYYAAVISLINAKGIHYTGWAWWVESANPAFPCLIGDWSGTPINGGVLVREDLKSHPAKGLG